MTSELVMLLMELGLSKENIGRVLDLVDKKPSKRAVAKSRTGPLPADWGPNATAFRVAREQKVAVQLVEPIFRDYLKSSGKQYLDYDAAFCNFLRNQRKFGTSNGQASGSLLDAIDRRIAGLELDEKSRGQVPEDHLFSLPQRSISGPGGLSAFLGGGADAVPEGSGALRVGSSNGRTAHLEMAPDHSRDR